MTTTLIALIGVRSVAILAQCVTLMEVAPSGSEAMKTMGAMITAMNLGKKYMEVETMTVEERAKKVVYEMGETGQIMKVAWAVEIEKALRDQIEDCAEVVDSHRGRGTFSHEIAEAIRALAAPTKETKKKGD